MKSIFSPGRIFVGAILVALNLNLFAAETDSPREHLSLDANWKFYLGDDWPNALRLDKAAASGGPASEKFNDTAWRSLDLPHDWAIELPFDKNSDTSHGYKPVGPGFPKNSVGWYRRTFDLPAQDSGKRIWLTFDGVFRDATVWVNGWLVTHHEGGYYPFRADITDITHFGGKNIVTVKVDASKFEGWFYEGAGIYRHVWLDKTAPVAIAPDGVFVYTKFNNDIPEGPAVIHIETTLKNYQTNSADDVAITQEIFGPEGKKIAQGISRPKFDSGKLGRIGASPDSLDAGDEENIKTLFVLQPGLIALPGKSIHKIDPSQSALPKFDPGLLPIISMTSGDLELWSPENPKLYKLVTTISVDGKMVDRKETAFGIRTLAFDAEKGFLLNGQRYEIQGTCNHQDMAGVGAALPDALQYFRIAKLKEFGCNALRTSHNPPTSELLDACDRLGMLVLDENRIVGSDTANLQKLEDQIRRDRNHPSVFAWSLGNEEWDSQGTDQGAAAIHTMQNLAHSLDPTRECTAAVNGSYGNTGYITVIDVKGFNYNLGSIDPYRAAHTNATFVGTETASTVTTRGIYANDTTNGYVAAYDYITKNKSGGLVNPVTWGETAEQWWTFYDARPWLSGGFAWTGFDYRGEPTPYNWPCINSHFGIMDMCGFPKDNFYYYQSWWTTNIVLHLLPHWNWPGKEGQEVRVDALSNCGEVELFLNGESLGKQTMRKNSHLTWQVKYAPGTLSAKGYNDGQLVAETKIETTGEPASVQLTPDRATISADGEDVSVVTVSVTDAQGRVVPVAGNKINFALEGAGKILGVGNGDPSCHEPDTFIAQPPVKDIPVNGWRWKLADVPSRGTLAPEYAPDFDDSSWNTIKPKTDVESGDQVLSEGQTAVFRAHFTLTEEDLNNPGVQIRFGGIDDHGWIFVNNQRVGESADWSAQPAFDIKKALHAGDNVVAVGVSNESGPGGLNPDVNVELIGKAVANAWSRSVFNGLAQVLVQSAKDAGEIKLTASAENLSPATISISSQASTPRPFVP
jgi:beta-galactosidase